MSGGMYRGSAATIIGRVGSAGTTAEQLDGVTGVKAAYGVVIKNIDATNDLLIGTEALKPTTTQGFVLQPGEEIELRIEQTDLIWVIASAATCAYTWIQN